MKRRLKPIEYSLVAIPVFMLAGTFILYSQRMSAIWEKREAHNRISCQSNLRQLGMAFQLYTTLYDDKLPLNQTGGPSSWRTVLGSEAETNSDLFHCPTAHQTTKALSASTADTDYWFNGNLTGLQTGIIEDSRQTLLSGEGSSGQNADYALTVLPKEWGENESSPAHRHSGGANYLFLDGHTKWFKSEDIIEHPKSWIIFKPQFTKHSSRKQHRSLVDVS